ncbi:hypothetical protein LCGC14_1915840, partial [marine sediment metagenome]
QDALASSAFQSPIPGLLANLEVTRNLIGGIVGAPLGNQLTNQQATDQITEGI